MKNKVIKEILKKHTLWLDNNSKGECANLSYANLRDVDLSYTDLSYADLKNTDLRNANLKGADLNHADFSGAYLSNANLKNANLRDVDLRNANLIGADLSYVNLKNADFSKANFSYANLRIADLRNANLDHAKGLIKTMGAEPGNYYWKRFDSGLNNNGYQFKVGLNKLKDGDIFNSDERDLCSYPGFHFASRSWCALNYSRRHLEAKIRIPEGAQINEPWATDGKASADMIEIIQVFDVKTGEDITNNYR